MKENELKIKIEEMMVVHENKIKPLSERESGIEIDDFSDDDSRSDSTSSHDDSDVNQSVESQSINVKPS